MKKNGNNKRLMNRESNKGRPMQWKFEMVEAMPANFTERIV